MSSKTLTLKIFRADELVDTKTLSQDVIKIGKLKSSHCVSMMTPSPACTRSSKSPATTSGSSTSAARPARCSTARRSTRTRRSTDGDTLNFGPYRVEIVEIADAVAAPAASAR